MKIDIYYEIILYVQGRLGTPGYSTYRGMI